MSEVLMVLKATPGGYLAWTPKNSALHEKLPDGTELVDRKEVDEALSQLAALRESQSTLFGAIEHGDEGHRNWLRLAIDAHFSGGAAPEYVASEKDDLIAALREELSQRDSFESLYNAAIDERDALREELDQTKRTAITEILALNSTLREQAKSLAAMSDRELEIAAEHADDLHQRLADAERRNALLETALKFYSDGDHLLLADPDEWDTCSGEPINWLHDSAGTASVEDGSIAKQALNPNPEAASQSGRCTFDEPCKCKTDKEKIWCGAWVEDEANE